ncbi:metalloregulator ArsR/SmtB family transcription factor [bacterium]|nr:MAG: metalloregulator ArsR/SmtB family transcription factor [bacterium]
MTVADTFKALGDPVRLEMVQRLASGASYTVGGLSNGLGITRQGARKHLQVLTEAKLITLEPKGRETQVRLDRDSLETARSFITELERRWDKRLEALRDFVELEAPVKEDSTVPA